MKNTVDRLSRRASPPVVIHDPPSADDMAKATGQIQKQLDAANQQLADAKRALDAAQKQAGAAPAAPPSTPPPWSFANYDLPDAKILELGEELFAIKSSLPAFTIIYQVPYDGPSMSLGHQLARAFTRANISNSLNWSSPSTPRDSGIFIRIADMRDIPDSAKKVQAAIEKITRVQPRIEAIGGLPPDTLALFVAPKP